MLKLKSMIKFSNIMSPDSKKNRKQKKKTEEKKNRI